MQDLDSPLATFSSPTAEPAPLPPSVNFHLWEPCNMRCRFCFATFQDVRQSVLPKGHLPREDALRVTEALAEHFEKITFAGGEPLLCPWLPDGATPPRSTSSNSRFISRCRARKGSPGPAPAKPPGVNGVVG